MKKKTIWKCDNTKNFDQVMVEEVYLNDISLKFTFDILLFHKINLQQNWINIHK
jgi:hypothetical protein